MNRKKTIGLVAGAFALLLSVGLLAPSLGAHLGLSSRVAEAGKTLTVEVEVYDSDYAGDMPGAFFIHGNIFPEGTLDTNGVNAGGADPIGKFYCWGWMSAGGGLVSQEYQLYDRGAIQVQGLELGADDRFAVVGGTGDFRKVSGEGFTENFNANFSFTVDFELNEARGH
jgi:hypothetical protein